MVPRGLFFIIVNFVNSFLVIIVMFVYLQVDNTQLLASCKSSTTPKYILHIHTYICSNSTYSICCGFVVQLVVQQIHNKSNKWSLSYTYMHKRNIKDRLCEFTVIVSIFLIISHSLYVLCPMSLINKNTEFDNTYTQDSVYGLSSQTRNEQKRIIDYAVFSSCLLWIGFKIVQITLKGHSMPST